MSSDRLAQRAADYLRRLCAYPHRRLGSAWNRAATETVAAWLAAAGWPVERQPFDCLDWVQGAATLAVGGQPYEVAISPYSLGCEVRAPLAVASTLDELHSLDARGRILLLRGALAREQLMPKGYPFYNPEEHQAIIAALEASAPAAILAATGRNPEMAGAVYPYALFQDGNLHIPSAYLTDVAGERLARLAGELAALTMDAQRLPSAGANVLARRGRDRPQRVVFCAHLDTAQDTPGALDNAGGVAVLVLLAELLAGEGERLGVEIVVFNGEDDYSAAGELTYLRAHEGQLERIALAVNLDAAGYRAGATAYSFYECPDALAATVRGALGVHPGLIEGDPWPQSDHMIFAMQGRPAVAVTSERLLEIKADYAHSPADRPEVVDPARLAELALALADLARALSAA